jgi:5-methylcytosine-specific restriction endonuclease McrA
MRGPTDPRYGSPRWKRLRKAILARDLWRCWALNCPVSANVADHIRPTYPGMPDAEFFDPSNLRASCRIHNLARAGEVLVAREVKPSPFGPRTGSIFGGRRGAR